VVWVARPESTRLSVVVVGAALAAGLGVVGALAGNALSGLGHWPYGLDVIRRHALRAMLLVFILTVVYAAGAQVWQRVRDIWAGRPWGHSARVYQGGAVPALAQSFQERNLVRELDAALAKRGDAVVTQVLSGMGGVGKTQLAVHCARHRRVDVLVWVAVSDRDSIVMQYAQAGGALAAAEGLDPQTAAQRFLTFLETTRCRWLVVLDDVPDAAAVRGLWPPSSPRGRTVVTTRSRDAALLGEGRARIDVGLFTAAQATAYLRSQLAAHARREPAEQLQGLAADLGYLPLALSQAVAYLIDTRLSCAEYRARLADRVARLDDLTPDPRSLPDDQPYALTAALRLSAERAGSQRPQGMAGPMLELVGMLDPAGVPDRVFTSDAVRTYLARQSSQTGDPVGTEQVHDTLALLHRLNVITLDLDGGPRAVRVHALTQRVIRETLTPSGYARAVRTAADAVESVWPPDDQVGDLGEVLRSNTALLIANGEEALWLGGMHPILVRVAESQSDAGLLVTATANFRQLAARASAAFGAQHPDTLRARRGVAICRGLAGDADGAVLALRAMASEFERMLGPDDLDTLYTRQMLTWFIWEQGHTMEAADAYTRLLEDQNRVVGPEHFSTLTTRHNLVACWSWAGFYDRALAAAEPLLADLLRIDGPDGRRTLGLRQNRAIWRGTLETPAEVIADLSAVVSDRIRLQGRLHPETLSARQALASWKSKTGEPGNILAAVAELKEVISDKERILGPDDPDVLKGRDTLADCQARAGQFRAATASYEDLVRDHRRIQGADHPDTLAARRALARLRGQAGNTDQALADLDALLQDDIRVHGPDQSATLATREARAATLEDSGDAAGALTAYEDLLRDYQRIFGPEHPDARAARQKLAHLRQGT
jgi:NB-ARC domain/Tetratricopeptide repeat